MKKLYILILLLAAGCLANAQNVVKGALFDESNGEAIPFANVALEGTTLGAVTDLNGFFLINKIPDGKYTLRVRYVGYEEYSTTVELSKHATVVKNIQLKPTATVLNIVDIVNKRTEEQKVETQVSVEKISSAQIQQMPSVGGQADLAQYLQVLPGISSTGDQGGQLYIRGGSMIQNLCMLDGMIVYNPFHSIGLYSIFETDVILNADIYTGGFGAEYGGRLSSVMDITTRDGNKKRHSGKVGLNTFGASLILEGPLKRETATSTTTLTYMLTAKNSFLSKSSTLLYPNIQGGLPFDFLDLYGKLSLNSGTGSKLNVFGFRFDDQVLGYQAIADYHWTNYGAGTNFVLVTGTSSILDGAIAYSNYRVTMNDNNATPKYSSIDGFNMSLNVTNFFGTDKLKYGVSMEGFSTDYQYVNQYYIKINQNAHNSQLSLYGTYNMKRDKWLIDMGLRVIDYASLSEFSPEPRLAAKYNATDRLRFKMAGGIYSQILLDARSDNDIVNLFNGFLTGSGALQHPDTFRGRDINSCLQRAQHIVLGGEYELTTDLSLNIETYYKNFSQLLTMNHNKMYDNNDPAYQEGGVFEQPEYYRTDFIIERGSATGLDVSLCYDADRLYVWGTYSLGYVHRSNETEDYCPHYDRRHTVNLLATYALGEHHEWEFSGRWSFGSGFPYTQTLGVYENLPFGNGIGTNYRNENGDFGVHYGEIYAGRLPNYHRLDLGVKRKFSIGKRGLLELNLSATNVYNRNNMFYFNRITFERVDQLPLMLCFGATMSF